jgi:signal transduction histidine kinase
MAPQGLWLTFREVESPLLAPLLTRLPAWAIDALLSGVLAVALIAGRVLEANGHHDFDRAALLGYVLCVLAALALAGRRRWPLVVFGVTLTVAVVAITLVPPAGAVSLPVMVAVYTLAQLDGRRRALLLAVLAAVALALARGVFQYRGWSDARTVLEPALAFAALFLGWELSSRRAYVAEIEARAVQAERSREEQARLQIDAERLRIARELHDVLAHGIATISVQAGVAAHVLHDQPEHAEQALRTIKATSREALRELRGILGVLRQAEETEPRAPEPGLGQIDGLLASIMDAGLPTHLVIRGEHRRLPASVDLAAYRIVQESLTNALRHAGRAQAVVSVSYGDDLTITVEDDGCGDLNGPLGVNGRAARENGQAGGENGQAGGGNGQASVHPGHGILGMRERAQALGGDLEAGPRANGGFRVSARLPIGAGA